MLSLPSPTVGARLRFVGAGALAADGHSFILKTQDDAEFFHGALVHHDTNQTGQTTSVVWGDGAADDTITVADTATGQAKRSVPLYTQASGLSSAAVNFTMKASGVSELLFTDFTLGSGSNITTQERAFFSF